MYKHNMYSPCWETTTEEEACNIYENYHQRLFHNYNHRTGETEWFYEDEGLSKIYLVMVVDTPRGKHYYKNINVIK